ncbi:MAG TPA: DUF4738 domain-containing protein [Prevotella sp.]|nr:DUF4738 domain-containing protein [Prevotella sp.]
MNKYLFIFFACLLLLTGCHQKPGKAVVQEDRQAKRMLQGIWINDDDDEIAFKAKGDTIYYPDSTSEPCYFMIVNDTLILKGANETKYLILKQAPHLFEFKNQTGDIVSLVKSSDSSDADAFMPKSPVAMNQLNQNQLIKRDSIVIFNNQHYHSYVQVNPTTYKVFKSSLNDNGVEIDNVYYDNIIHISLFHGDLQIFSHDFHKDDFQRQVRTDILKQCILSDILFQGMDKDGAHYLAEICLPDSPSSYEVKIIISYQGKLKMFI